MLNVSRPRLEVTACRHLLTRSNMRIMENGAVQGFVFNEDRSRVTGVHLRSRESVSDETILNADLVIDATGRGSRLPDWLETMGYARPQEEHVRIDVCYTSRQYRGEEHLFSGKQTIIIRPEVSNRHPFGSAVLSLHYWNHRCCLEHDGGGNDLRVPEVQGPRTEQTQYINWYLERIEQAAHRDPVVVHAFARVGNMIAPASSLMSPEIIWHLFGQTAEQEPEPVNAQMEKGQAV